MPALKWVMLVALINGPTNEAVLMNDLSVNREVGQFGLKSVLPCEPREAPRSEIAPKEPWFDVVCYGIDIQTQSSFGAGAGFIST